MSRLIWPPQALFDVQRFYRLLSIKNVDAAKRAIKSLRHDVKVLEHQAEIGRPIEDMPEEFRKRVIDFGDSGYVARYRVGSDVIVILAVRHQKEVGY